MLVAIWHKPAPKRNSIARNNREPLHTGPQSRLQGYALVRAWPFPHHGWNKSHSRNAVGEAENIVAQTAERIFADLADAQTVNSDKKGAWKAPLWQALSEAGLPLAWVPEDCGGSGASLAEGFSVLSAAGRFALAVPLAETMLAGWLLAQTKISSPDGEMTVAPASPKDRVTLN